jgi:8-oxo-dGTP pyrophosphatase MutT (NUDIX family)
MFARINKSTTLHKGKVFRWVSENITLSNGAEIDMDIIRHPGASAVVPLLNHNTVVLIKQYRHAILDCIWEIPAGTLRMEETAMDCAKRELIEETGFSAREWQKLGEIIPLPGYTDERIHVFLATGLEPAGQNLDCDEMLDVHEVEFDQAMAMIYNGDIQDGKTIFGLFMTLHRLEQNQKIAKEAIK